MKQLLPREPRTWWGGNFQINSWNRSWVKSRRQQDTWLFWELTLLNNHRLSGRWDTNELRIHPVQGGAADFNGSPSHVTHFHWFAPVCFVSSGWSKGYNSGDLSGSITCNHVRVHTAQTEELWQNKKKERKIDRNAVVSSQLGPPTHSLRGC